MKDGMECGTKSGGLMVEVQCKTWKVVKQLLIRERLNKKRSGYHGGAFNQVK